MSQETWSAVDRYFEQSIVPADADLEGALAASKAAGLPDIQVAPNQGKLLHMLARLCQAKRILEIGTLGGYSTIWLARALPQNGRLVTLEVDPAHAAVAQQTFERVGLADRIELRLGRATELLPQVERDGCGPFDLTFIDADKESSADYFNWALHLSRPGSVIVVDNVVREGAVIDAASVDSRVQGVRRLIELLAGEPRVSTTFLQTVGTKGYDGLVIAWVND